MVSLSKATIRLQNNKTSVLFPKPDQTRQIFKQPVAGLAAILAITDGQRRIGECRDEFSLG
jgi:hypothetical protein